MDNSYKNLKQFIQLIEKKNKCKITIFDPYCMFRQLDGFTYTFSDESFHDSDYCNHVKSDMVLWHRCVRCKWQAVDQLKTKKEAFYGECCFGVGEYVYPLLDRNRLIGYIGAYGFKKKDDGQMEKTLFLLSKRVKATNEEIKHEYNDLFTERLDDWSELSVQIAIIAQLLMQYLYRAQADFSQLPNKLEESQLTVIKAMEFINQKYKTEIKVKDIADFCHISESYLYHLFNRTYNQSPYETLVHRRLGEAARLLAETTYPISIVAQKSGFHDGNYLSSVFHKAYGVTCLKYRKRYIKHG